ncbi:MAG: type II secretion system protein N [Gammaproteobacteria bacterium]
MSRRVAAWLPRRRAAAFARSTHAESTLSELAWERRRHATRRWALWGILVGALLALPAFAPAAWLARALAAGTDGRLLLADARGTAWRGSAVPVLTGGPDSRDAAALPGRLGWQLRWRGSGFDLVLTHDGCIDGDLVLHWQPGLSRQTLALQPRADGAVGQWPMAWLAGLGTPWNTLQPGGRARLSASAARFVWAGNRVAFDGAAQLDLLGVSSRLSTVDPLGSYRLTLQGQGDGATALALSTLDGALRLDGSGRLAGGRLQFRGRGQAAPGSEAALDNLLNIIGRRQGASTLVSIG